MSWVPFQDVAENENLVRRSTRRWLSFMVGGCDRQKRVRQAGPTLSWRLF